MSSDNFVFIFYINKKSFISFNQVPCNNLSLNFIIYQYYQNMKKANKKINAAIIIIGNEILSGRTQDVNVGSYIKMA